ncbi:hypothetical protein WN48_03191 [Eufriesea mexicana]|nr:hypothetical protein WN48_03191 [Eufriesea mexicana]
MSCKGDKKITKNCSYASHKIIRENILRLYALKLRKSFSIVINYHVTKDLAYIENVLICLQNNQTDGKEDLPEDTFSLLSVLLVGSLNFPFDRSRLAPRRQPPSERPFTRKL